MFAVATLTDIVTSVMWPMLVGLHGKRGKWTSLVRRLLICLASCLYTSALAIYGFVCELPPSISAIADVQIVLTLKMISGAVSYHDGLRSVLSPADKAALVSAKTYIGQRLS